MRISIIASSWTGQGRLDDYAAAGCGADPQLPTKLFHPLPHPCDSHPESHHAINKFSVLPGWDPFAYVLDLEPHSARVQENLDRGRRASRVTVHVRQALLDDAEQRRLDLLRQAAELGGHMQTNPDAAALREPVHVPAQGRGKPVLVEQRRGQGGTKRGGFAPALVGGVQAFSGGFAGPAVGLTGRLFYPPEG